MRVHYISPSTLPSRSANAVHVALQCEALMRRGAEVTLYARRAMPDSNCLPDALRQSYGVDAAGIELVTYYSRRDRFTSGRIAAAACRRLAFSTSGSPVLSRNLYAAFALGVVRRRPLIFETHQLEYGVRRPLQRLVMTRPWVLTVVISEQLVHWLSVHHRQPPHRVLVLPDAARDGIVPIDERSRRAALVEQAPAAGGNWRAVCGYFGHLYSGRGLEIIEAMAAARPASLFLVYGGTEASIASRRSRPARENLRFMGHVSHVAATALMRTVDMLLMPYQEHVSIGVDRHDTARWMSPMKMFEYMAAGVPMIASDLPALREVLQHEVNSLLVAPSAIDAWLAAHDRLIEDPGLARTIAANAHARYRACHTWSHRAARLLEAARSL